MRRLAASTRSTLPTLVLGGGPRPIARGLVRRGPHPTDRRAKLVEATRKGKDLARRADAILATPPEALSALGPDDLETLRRILQSVS